MAGSSSPLSSFPAPRESRRLSSVACANSVIDERTLRLSGQPKMSWTIGPDPRDQPRALPQRGPSTSCARSARARRVRRCHSAALSRYGQFAQLRKHEPDPMAAFSALPSSPTRCRRPGPGRRQSAAGRKDRRPSTRTVCLPPCRLQVSQASVRDSMTTTTVPETRLSRSRRRNPEVCGVACYPG